MLLCHPVMVLRLVIGSLGSDRMVLWVVILLLLSIVGCRLDQLQISARATLRTLVSLLCHSMRG